MPDADEWNITTLHYYMQAMRESDARLQQERDRRYAEVSMEREKALRIKEQADRDALELARQIQSYKDEKANELREQINRERVLYATKEDVAAAVEKIEATITPLVNYAATQQGGATGKSASQQFYMVMIPALVIALLSIVGAIVAVAYALKR